MNFEEWEKEQSAELCPHCSKTFYIMVTRCRQCVWDASRKEAIREVITRFKEAKNKTEEFGDWDFFKWLDNEANKK